MYDGVGWVVLADEGVLIAAVASASATAAAAHRALSGLFLRTTVGRTTLGGLIGIGRVAVVLLSGLLAGAVVDVPAGFTAATPPPATPPPAPTGCPPAGSNQVSQMSLPARLIIDQFQSSPSTLDGGTQSFVLRVHITSTCGGSVQGAIVYGTPTPFNQFGETQSNTASDGWATLNFSRQPNYPVNGKQQILAMFLRASKPGESVLAGITGFRLVNVNVNL